ncbi:MAG: hypothetical protein VB120_04890 [Lachnospiraceae bacterium]|nr:hypothetical protein [Lachnospiraceae bacterium]
MEAAVAVPKKSLYVIISAQQKIDIMVKKKLAFAPFLQFPHLNKLILPFILFFGMPVIIFSRSYFCANMFFRCEFGRERGDIIWKN